MRTRDLGPAGVKQSNECVCAYTYPTLYLHILFCSILLCYVFILLLYYIAIITFGNNTHAAYSVGIPTRDTRMPTL